MKTEYSEIEKIAKEQFPETWIVSTQRFGEFDISAFQRDAYIRGYQEALKNINNETTTRLPST